MNVTIEQLRERVMARQGATFAEVVTDTAPETRKTGNPYFGRVRRIARRNVMLGTSYANDVNNQRVREGQPTDELGNVEPFVAEQLWKGKGEHVGPNVARHTETGQEYLVAFPVRRTAEGHPIVDEDLWLLDGVAVDKAVIEPHLKPVGVNKSQQVERKIPWRTIKLENVKELALDGEVLSVV